MAGDTLAIHRYGYQDLSIPITDDTYYQIELTPLAINLPAINAYSQRRLPTGQQAYQIITGEQLSPTALAYKVPALILRRYGGSAGVTTIAINGSPSNHTKVILENVDLTDPLMGQTDLSQLPGSLLREITVEPNPGINQGSGAMGGAIYLHAVPENSSATITAGQNGYRATDVHIKWNRPRLTGSATLGQVNDGGNYPVVWRDSTIIRRNNHYNQRSGTLNLNYLPSDRHFGNLFIMVSDQERGIAGVIWSPTPDASRNSILQIANLSWGRILSHGIIKFRFSNRHSALEYRDPQSAIDSRHISNTQILRLSVRSKMWPAFSFTSFVEGRAEAISSSDAGNHDRMLLAAALLGDMALGRSFRFKPSCRYDFAPNLYSQSSFDLTLSYFPFNPVKLDASVGTAFRYPTFSDLYWLPGGNPDLQPENSAYFALSASLDLPGETMVRLYHSQRISNDLIQWIPDGATSRAVNLARTRNIATALTVSGKLPPGHWRYDLGLNHFHAANLETGTTLLNIPGWTAHGRLWFQNNDITSGINLAYEGQRIRGYSWPNHVYLEAFLTMDIFASYSLPIRRQRMDFQAYLSNLTNKNYMTIYGYPEAGRALRVAITFNFNQS